MFHHRSTTLRKDKYELSFGKLVPGLNNGSGDPKELNYIGHHFGLGEARLVEETETVDADWQNFIAFLEESRKNGRHVLLSAEQFQNVNMNIKLL